MNSNDLHKFEHELIENDSFIRWVKSEFEVDNKYWSDFIDSHEDQMDNINKAINTVRYLSFGDVSDIDVTKLWHRIEVSTKSNTKNAPRQFHLFAFNRILLGLAAACLASILIFYFAFNNNLKNISTGAGEQVSIVLPDGSKVLLSANSNIKYSPVKWKNQRDITLDGLAFFEVEKGSQFRVLTASGNVTVLGTSFSVNARNRHFQVICKTGKVGVDVKDEKVDNVVLLPGDKVSVKNGKFEHHMARNEIFNEITWLNGVYTFENDLLRDVIGELENQFGVNIVITDSLKGLKYTGYFHKGDLNKALYSVTWPLQLKYSVVGNKVEIYK